MDNLEIADRLDGAAAYGEEHGWCAGQSEDPLGRVCAIGAIRRACGGRPDHMSLSIALLVDAAVRFTDRVAMRRGFPVHPGGLVATACYSDTHADADRASMLREAAHLARESVKQPACAGAAS